MTKLKGLRDIQTLYGQAHRARSRTRAQVVAELAYLEHEKDRLERELAIWQANQKQAQRRLAFVRERVALLQGILEPQPPARRDRQMPAAQAHEDSPVTAARWRETTLEY